MKTKHILKSMLAGALLFGAASPGNATVLTSFEADEGFVTNSRTGPEGWTFSNNPRIRVSDGETEPALLGSLSLYTEGGSSAVSASNLSDWASAEDKFNIYSFSFISPTTTWVNQGNLAWVYIMLWDEQAQTERALQLWVKYGSTAAAAYRIQYGTSAENAYTNIAQSSMDFSTWNTISVKFDSAWETYSISLNDTTVVQNVLLPADWDVSAIVGTRLTSPVSGTITYYDVVMAVPEPSIIGLGILSGWLLLMRRRFRLR